MGQNYTIIQILQDTYGNISRFYDMLSDIYKKNKTIAEHYSEEYVKIQQFLYTSLYNDISQEDYEKKTALYRCAHDALTKGNFAYIDEFLG